MNIKHTVRATFMAILAYLTLFGATVHASTAVTLPTGMTLTQETPENMVLGFEFSVNFATNVTSIGVFDEGGDGFSSPHSAAIWDDSGNIISQILFSTNSGAMDNGFRYIDLINPVDLDPGLKYVIGVFYSVVNIDSIAVAMFDSEYTLDPNVVITGGRSSSGGFGLPDMETSEVYFGPNFRFTAVPVPGAVWLLASALGGLALSQRR